MKKYFTSLMFVSMSMVATAQWNSNIATNLELAALPTADMQTVTTSDGRTWIAFYHQNGSNYDMRAQLLDVNGNKLLGTNGLLVCSQTSGSATYVFNVCLDAADNLIIAFQYQVSGTNTAVVTKVTTAGTLPWGTAGVVVGNGLAPYPALLTTGDIAVAWNNGTTNTLNIQKYSTAGTAAFTTPVEVKVGTTLTTRGQVIGTNEGTITMVFQKKGTGVSSTLYAQRYSAEGITVWAAPVQISTQTTSSARYYSIRAEADTTYFGYYSSVGSRFNSFVQRVNPDGTIPYGSNGAAFDDNQGSTDNYQQATNIALAPGSNYLWALCTYSNTGQSQYGIYVQKFLKGTGAKQLGSAAKNLYPISANFDTQTGPITLVNDAPIFMHYNVNYIIYASRLDASGNFVWPGNYVTLSSTTAGGSTPKGRFNFSYINGQGVAVWYENRGTEYRGYAQNITAAGTTGPALPVLFSSFLGNRNGKQHDLFWTTATETNSKGFYVERSADGTSFSSLGYMASRAINGNSLVSNNYTFIDAQPLMGNNYYRLKQVDKDGRPTYSGTILIKQDKTGNLVLNMVYPNPVKDQLRLSITSIAATSVSYTITSAAGKIVQQQTGPISLGSNLVTMQVAGLAKGHYFIKVINELGEGSTQPFVKE